MCYIRNQQKLPIDALDVDLGELVSRCDERVRVKLFVGKLVRRHERRAGRLDHRGIAAGIDLVIGMVGKVLGNRLMDVPSPPGPRRIRFGQHRNKSKPSFPGFLFPREVGHIEVCGAATAPVEGDLAAEVAIDQILDHRPSATS